MVMVRGREKRVGDVDATGDGRRGQVVKGDDRGRLVRMLRPRKMGRGRRM